MQRLNTTHVILVGIILIRMVASLWFAINTPLWEKSDEINHYLYARFIAAEGRLPTSDDFPDLPQDQGLEIYVQFDQPPLYYLMLAPIIALADGVEMALPTPNPRPEGYNPFLHYFTHPSDQSFADNGAIWLARIFNMILGAVTTFFVWLTMRILQPKLPSVALFTAFIFAVYPAGVEFSTWVNNDAPLMLYGAIILVLLAYRKQHGINRRLLAALAIVTICALATKLNGIVLIPTILLSIWPFTLQLLQKRHMRRLALITFVVVAVVVLFFLLNQAHCDRILCRIHRTDFIFNTPQKLVDSLQPTHFVDGFDHLIRTSAVPWINRSYPPPEWLLFPAYVLLGCGLLGFFVGLIRRDELTSGLWPALIALLFALGLAIMRVWWLQVGYMPARYLAIAMPGMMMIMSVGYTILARYLHHSVLVGVVVGWILLLVITLPATYTPVYKQPPRFDDLPSMATPVDSYRFESGLDIAGYDIRDREIVLFMETAQPTIEPLFVLITIFDQAGNELENSGRTAGTALWTTPDWQPGEIVEQSFRIMRLSEAYSFEISSYYFMNDYYLFNYYDSEKPDERISGGLLALP